MPQTIGEWLITVFLVCVFTALPLMVLGFALAIRSALRQPERWRAARRILLSWSFYPEIDPKGALLIGLGAGMAFVGFTAALVAVLLSERCIPTP